MDINSNNSTILLTTIGMTRICQGTLSSDVIGGF